MLPLSQEKKDLAIFSSFLTDTPEAVSALDSLVCSSEEADPADPRHHLL
jgi:hypothetical protein